jgi:hypothetical protein
MYSIMKKIIILIAIGTWMVPLKTLAQGSYMSFEYVMGFPTGDLGDFIGKASFRGAVIEYQKYLRNNLSVGIETGWSAFYERKDYDTYSEGNASVSGIQYRYSSQVPILISAEYNFRPDATVKPYANFALGTMYSRRDTDMGMWYIEEVAWHFALKPEVGVMIGINLNTSVNLSAKYYTGFAAGDLATQSYFGLGVGFVFQF